MTPVDPADCLLAAALATGASYEVAGRHAGVSKATVKRRMADPGFRAQVGELRADHVRRVEERLGQLSSAALDAIEDLLGDREAPAQRLGAARMTLEGMLRYRDAGEVAQRLAELETRALADEAEELARELGAAMRRRDIPAEVVSEVCGVAETAAERLNGSPGVLA